MVSRMNFFLLMIFGVAAGSAAADGQLETLLKKVEAPDSSLKSIDEVIGLHPNPRADHTMRMHKSLSDEDASITHPRYLSIDPNSGLLTGFNGHPEQSGYETLQLAEPHGAEWEWADVRKVKGQLVVRRRPKTCLRCHGNGQEPERWVPLVRPYSTWEGAHGREDDVMTAEEAAQFQKHVEVALGHDRYKKFIIDTEGDPRGFEDSLGERKKAGGPLVYLNERGRKKEAYNRRPNVNFTTATAAYHARVLAERALSSPRLEAYLTYRFIFECRHHFSSRDSDRAEQASLELTRLLQQKLPPGPAYERNFGRLFWFLGLSAEELQLRGKKLPALTSYYPNVFDAWIDGSALSLQESIDGHILRKLDSKINDAWGFPSVSNKKHPYLLATATSLPPREELRTWEIPKKSKRITDLCSKALTKFEKYLETEKASLSETKVVNEGLKQNKRH
jgi:hypothetical protein